MGYRSFLLAALGSFWLPFGAAAQDSGPTALTPFSSPEHLQERQLAEIDATLTRAMETGDFVGLAVAIVRDGKTVFLETYGETEAGGGAAVTPDTRFRIASLSKGIASSAVALGVTEGKLSLEQPATDFAPTLALANNGQQSLTLSHVLSHRTGLPPNAYDNLLEAGVSPDEILPQYRKVKPICPVGRCYAYQNITYDIAGRAVSAAYGLSYADFIETRLFKPLGMTSASFGADALMQNDDWARPHRRQRQRDRTAPPHPWRTVAVNEPYYTTPAAGGVNASIRDMAEWLKAQMGGAPEVLSQRALNMIHAPQVRTPAESRRTRSVMENLRSSQYGYGWRLYEYAGGARVIAHGGSVDGYGAHIVFIPEEQAGIVILSNTRTRRLWSIAPMFLDLTLSQPRKDWLALEDDEASAFAGSK